MLSWHARGTRNAAEVATQLQELQSDTLRLFLVLATVGYVAWHLVDVQLFPRAQMTRAYAILPVVVPVLLGTHLLLSVHPRAATWLFVGGGFCAVSWAVLLLGPPPALLYGALALVAAFVLSTPAGFAVIGGGSVLLLGLRGTRPEMAAASEVWAMAIFGATAVVGVWALKHRLLLVLCWYMQSYEEAERRAREAREHRAQLVQTTRQLDIACYRLERANAALQLAWRAADQAERSRMEFATTISHELRTPLNLIVGYSEMMMTSPGSYGGIPLPPAYRGDLSAIYRAAQHLLALTDDVLDLARMEVGRLGLLRETVDLTQIVRDAATLVRDYMEARGLELRLDLPDDLPPLLLDRLRIRQVVLNLLVNAVRFTERGHIGVRVARGDHEVRVSVSDTGPGIAPDDLAALFQRFVTSGEHRAEWHSGTGLGLAISKRFVEMHGGDMGAESVPGQGATFWFTLPLVPADRGGVPVVSPSHPLPATPGQPEQVLVLAHPDAALARLLQRHLGRYRVETADGLAAAGARALEVRAAAVIADLAVAPDWDHGSVPLLRCPLPRQERRADRLGVADHLLKPVSREDLLRAIARLDGPIQRVLVVDDDTRFVRFLGRLLSSVGQGYAVSTAHNGEEALVKLRGERPDLMLLDLAMPGLDGPGVLRRMADEPDLARTRVLVVSARDEAEECGILGSEIHLTKPEGFRLAELTEILGVLLSALTPGRGYLDTTVPAPPGAAPG